MNEFEISAILYQENNIWIAQGLEYDITAQASSPLNAHQQFAVKVATEIAISFDLQKEPLEGIAPAPRKFWHMFEVAKMTVDAESPPVRILDGAPIPRIVPRMKLGQLELA